MSVRDRTSIASLTSAFLMTRSANRAAPARNVAFASGTESTIVAKKRWMVDGDRPNVFAIASAA